MKRHWKSIIFAIFILLAVGYHWLMYINPFKNDVIGPASLKYLVQRGDIPRHIEGYTPGDLMKYYPGMIAMDFSNVEAVDGKYVLSGEYITFEGLNVKSDSTSISDKGYETLSKNIQKRLGYGSGSSDWMPARNISLMTDELESKGSLVDKFMIWYKRAFAQ